MIWHELTIIVSQRASFRFLLVSACFYATSFVSLLGQIFESRCEKKERHFKVRFKKIGSGGGKKRTAKKTIKQQKNWQQYLHPL